MHYFHGLVINIGRFGWKQFSQIKGLCNIPEIFHELNFRGFGPIREHYAPQKFGTVRYFTACLYML